LTPQVSLDMVVMRKIPVPGKNRIIVIHPVVSHCTGWTILYHQQYIMSSQKAYNYYITVNVIFLKYNNDTLKHSHFWKLYGNIRIYTMHGNSNREYITYTGLPKILALKVMKKLGHYSHVRIWCSKKWNRHKRPELTWPDAGSWHS
jgi:hypothetical protein